MAARVRPEWGGRVGSHRGRGAGHGWIAPEPPKANHLRGKRIGLQGVAFKLNTDDVREAPVPAVARRLLDKGAEVRGSDPQAATKAELAFSELTICADPCAVATHAEAIILCTEWAEFPGLDWARVKAQMIRPLILDSRNDLDREKLTWLEFEYIGIRRSAGGAGMKGKSRSLVVGGAGFLGSHQYDRLIREGHEMICIDNLITRDVNNVVHLLGQEGLRFIKIRRDRLPACRGPVGVHPPFRLACQSRELSAPAHPDPEGGPLDTYKALGWPRPRERGSCLRPLRRCTGAPSPSPAGKLLGAREPGGAATGVRRGQTLRRCHDHGLPPVPQRGDPVARIFNTYGPRMRPQDGRVVSNFLIQTLAGRPLTVHGDGRQTRSFCFVSTWWRGCSASRRPRRRSRSTWAIRPSGASQTSWPPSRRS